METAFAIACRRIGELDVEVERMRGEIARLTADCEEAGRKILELTTHQDAAAHDG